MVDKLAPDQNGADDDMDDSIRADLEAAIRGAEEAAEPPAAAEPAPAAPETQPPAAGPARGADGKFVSPAAAPPAAAPSAPAMPAAPAQASQQQAAGAQPPVDRPPPGWSVQSKADYAALPPHIRADIAKREAEISAGFRQYSEKLKGYEGYEQLMDRRAPDGSTWRARMEATGETPVAAMQRLLAAQEALETRPVQAIAWLAKEYGVDLRQFGGQPAQQPVLGADGKPPPQHLQTLLQSMIKQALEPAIQPVLQKVETFEQSWQTREQQERAAQEAALVAEVEAFASDPAHPYFDNVLPQVVALIKGGAAKTLDEAYQMAVYANPETRQRLISEQQAATLREQQARQQRVASDARKAGGSITGAPADPASAGGQGAPPDDLRGALEQAWNLHAGRA